MAIMMRFVYLLAAITAGTWQQSTAVMPPVLYPAPAATIAPTTTATPAVASNTTAVAGVVTAPLVSISLPPVLVNMTRDWGCPYVRGVAEVSCTCDVPHTVRCRGQADRPHDLISLIHNLGIKGSISLLDLAVHGLRELPGRVFTSMELLGLVITTADLQTLPHDAFSGLENTLAALGLPNNKLVEVPANALRPLVELQRLDLSDNQIRELPPRAFPVLPQLQNLDLAGNNLQVLHSEAFLHLPNLVSLNLANNELDAAQINEKSLRGLHALQRLSLKSNLLKGAVTSTLIKGAKGLTSVDLSGNALTMLSRGSLAACPNIRELDLSRNNIDVIEDHAFANLSQLQHLKLSHNSVVAVSGWSLAHLPQLTYLAMADNALRAVTADLLHQLSALKSLDLAANDISLIQPYVFNSTPALQHLILTDNPLHCDCTLTWLWQWLVHHPSLTHEEQLSTVCATPPALENAPLIELRQSQLVCSEEDVSNHDYFHDYHDYYHDEATAEETPDMRRSDAEISLQVAHWVRKDDSEQNNGQALDKESHLAVELVWRVEDKAIPYSCEAVFVYEVVQGTPDSHQVLAEKVAANCSSDDIHDPHQVVVTVPGEVLVPGATYRYCLMLLERGTGDQEAFLPGCSEPLLLTAAPFTLPKQRGSSPVLRVTSLTAGGVGGALVVHTRVDGSDGPCTYTLAIVAGHRIAATRQLNCSEARHEFPSLAEGQYVACADPDVSGITHDFSHLEHHLKAAENVTTALHQDFSICTPVITFTPYRDQGIGTGPLLTLLFTLPGLALVVTLYVIARRVWRGGGVPWRWDPRTQKNGKYFLYTGEVPTPSLSLDPLPADNPETTTPV
nr:leucine-rich repeat neuronal protein 3-like [Cherax quadricarinatus]